MIKIWANIVQRDLFLPEGQKKASVEGRSPPQELEVGPSSGPHLPVYITQAQE